MHSWWHNLRDLSLGKQLTLAVGIGIICLALVSSLTLSAFASRAERASLMTQGEKLAGNLARQSTLAVLYGSAENVEDALGATMAFPNVDAATVHDLTGRTIAAAGDERVFSGLADSGVQSIRAMPGGETDRHWIFHAPVYSLGAAEGEAESPFELTRPEQEQIGYVRMALSKAPLQQAVMGILAVNIPVSLLLAVLMLAVLRLITERLNRPLRDLADIMQRSETGEAGLRAATEGPSDVTDMAQAFNMMMDVLEDRERQLRQARDAAIEMARIKSEFAASVSHELRTPLNGVIGMLDLLDQYRMPPRQAEYLRVARGSATNLMSLVNDILDFSKVEAGKLELEDSEFSLREMLEEVSDLLSGQVAKKGLELGYVMAEDLPERMRGKRMALQQVVTNLVANAVKFTESGEVAVSVEALEEDDEFITLYFRVSDTGVGIEEADRERIFESFAQAEGSHTRRHGGTGLGLAITRRLVDAMGGEIGVESEPGRGSTFWFVAGFGRVEHGQAMPGMDFTQFAGRRVLTVHSFGVVERFLHTTMTAWQVEHTIAGSPRQALRVLRNSARRGREFDLVLVDSAVEGMPVSEFVHRLKADAGIAATRVVVLVPGRRPLPEGLANHSGISACVPKPLTLRHLYQCFIGEPEMPQESTQGLEPLQGNVLLVEDNRTNQQVAEGMLQSLGCQVTIAADGEEGVRLWSEGNFDAVLMDCNMPRLDGYDATAHIRELEKGEQRTPIIALTANALEGDSQRCLDAGMDDYLAKPLSLKLLRAALERWLPPTVISASETASEEDAEYGASDSINQRTLANLRAAIGGRFPAMVAVFLEDAEGYLGQLQIALQQENLKSFTNLAHALKGGCRNLGVDYLGDLARGLEDIGKSGDLTQAETLLERARKELASVRESLGREAARPVAEESADAGEEQTPAILLVDDDRGTRFALRHALEQDGYRVLEAESGEAALHLCRREIPDVVLMDAVMPDGDGFETCREMRSIPALEHTPVLIVTALDDEDSVEQAFAAGASDFIPKPINFGLLRQRVGRMVHAGRNERRVRELALHDPLTGLPNRHLFRDQIDQLAGLASHKDVSMAVMVLDLDRFKTINDSLGHNAGDLLLKSVADRLVRCLRGGDTVAHLGGDEFGVLLYGLAYPGVATRVADKIRGVMSEPFVIQGNELFCGVSIGIAFYGEDGTTATELLKHADIAMYRAKSRGNTYQCYESGMEADARRRLVLEKDIRNSLNNGDFIVHYQPQLDLQSGRLLGAEALVRWEHPEQGLVMPLEFIALAEDTGLIEEIEQHVLYTVCEQQVLWREAGYKSHILSVNLSGRRMMQPDLVESIAEVIERTGANAEQLSLEVTETVLMSTSSRNRELLEKFRAMGLTLAMDDFGTGYSSLSYLKNLPIDVLKIDRSFVRDVCTDRYDAAMLGGIIKLAHGLGLRLVAEGVETEAQRNFLREHGCDAMQGYLISRPLPGDEYESRILHGAQAEDSRVIPLSSHKR